MPTSSCFLVGAGGHGRVVFDALRRADAVEEIVVCDENPARAGTPFFECVVHAPLELCTLPRLGHISIGCNRVRRELVHRLIESGKGLLSITHPAAMVADTAALGQGTFVAAGAIVAPYVNAGDGTIINHGAIVDHDCVVGAFTHIAPGAILGGGVQVGDECLLGSRAVVLPGVRIGRGSTVGAGAVVTKDIPPGSIAMGAPASVEGSNDEDR